MRLTPHEIAAIKECAAAHFGSGAVVRLFGSRLRDDLRGGDIDLHITTDGELTDEYGAEFRFKHDLENRIGEQRIDLLVNGPGGPQRPIERIAVETGVVIPDVRDVATVCAETDPFRGRADMASSSHVELLTEALDAGERTKANLARLLDELSPEMPLTAATIGELDWIGRLRTDSLLLQFSNMVAVVQDQMIRSILIAAEEPVARQSRIDQRNIAEKLGALPGGIDFKAIIDARNGIAHQYPADLARQAKVVNDVVEVTPALVRAFTSLAAYARSRVLDRE